MDVRTGDIFEERKVAIERDEFIKRMVLHPSVKQLRRRPVHPDAVGRVGRNEPCPCGSGKKFKKCCLTSE